MIRGEIWIIALPSSSGREQAGERPGVVLQDAAQGQGSPLVLVAPFTSSLAAMRFPATVQIEPTAENGLSMISVTMVFQVRALDRSRFVRRLGVVSDNSIADIFTALDALTGR